MITSFAGSLTAQTFLFEDVAVPTAWTSSAEGQLSLSNKHFKEGSQSLVWEVNGPGVLSINFPGFTASTGNSAFLQIYSPEVTNDTLVVEFLNNALVRRTANYLLNYKGWRDFNRAYTEYVSNVSFTVTSVRMTLKPASAGTRIIAFDNVRFNQSTTTNRLMGGQWLLDRQFLNVNAAQLNLLANPIDIPLTSPSQNEIDDLNALRTKFKRTPVAANATNLNNAKSFVNALNIVRNDDGTVTGSVINTSFTALTTAVVTDYVNKLEMLAAEGLKDMPTLGLFRDFLDHLIEQGFAEGVQFSIRSNDYTASRAIPAKLLNLLPACTMAQTTEVLKLVRWISYYGHLYDSESNYLSNLNSDVVYLYLPHMLGVALFQTDDAVAVREMKAYKRFLERNTESVPGGGDILKPDGTGFHHNTHYNNYMYSYQTWAEGIIGLQGTSFRISPSAYERFKKAIIAKYTMATLDSNNTRHYANTLSGRNPFGPGITLFYSRTLFEQLIQAGGDILGKDIDEDLASAYNYFFQSTKYPVSAKSYEGFHQFNYSPMGIYRKNNWVATMRAPTTKFWGAEIYNAENRFGRYQSHGTLEITYSGTQATSGYPGSSNGGGWDWNVVPGTTTVHYTSWPEMMPNKNVTDRFDQYTKTKNFSGALAWGNYGIFATDFDQGDAWGSQRFVPTNLVFKKSMFAFDGMIFSLGSNISSSGLYDASMITATNLFQSLIFSQSGPLILNGEALSQPYQQSLSSSSDHWMISPQGTGYFLPSGNDNIRIVYDFQKTPYETGSDVANPVTNALAAKAFIEHGVKPSSKSYFFVAVPAASITAMQTLAPKMSPHGGEIYKIQRQDQLLHAMTYLPKEVTAYTFFGAVSGLDFGVVKSSTAEHLLMHRAEEVSGRHFFAASNPNLRPVNDAVYGWVASPSQTTITLKGEWYPLELIEGVTFTEPENNETQITIHFTDGEPVYFGIGNIGQTSLSRHSMRDYPAFAYQQDELYVFPKEPLIRMTIYSTSGIRMSAHNLLENSERITIPVSHLPAGLYVSSVETISGELINVKWMKHE